MSRRIAALVGFVALLAFLGSVPSASAATYPPGNNTVVINGGSTNVVVGDDVPIAASSFVAGSEVTFTISSPAGALGSLRGGALAGTAAGGCGTGSSCVVTAAADGVATAQVTFTRAGMTTITATGVGLDDKALTVTATVDVAAVAADAANQGGLARTGADLIKYGVIGLGLVAIGALIVVAVRRRGIHTAA